MTLAPEQYRHWMQEAKDHQEKGLSRPLFISCNKKGDTIWSNSSADCIFMGNHHNPMKIKALGQPYNTGKASKTLVPCDKAQYNKPAGVKCITTSELEEICLVSDCKNKTLRRISKCTDIYAKQLASTMGITGAPAEFQPVGIDAMLSGNGLLIVVSQNRSRDILLMKTDKAANSCHVIQIFAGFVSPTGVTAMRQTTGTVVVADGTEVKPLDLETSAISTAISGMKSAGDVAVNDIGQLAVTDPESNKVFIFELRGDAFEIVDELGSGLPGNGDGSFKDASLDEPL